MIGKRFSLFTILAFGLVMVAGNASAGSIHVEKSVTLPATPEQVWKVLMDYNGLDNWHPAVQYSTVSGNSMTPGTVRTLTLAGSGAQIVEELVKFDDSHMSYTYKILNSPLPVSGYVSSLGIKGDGNGMATVTWVSDFQANGAPDDEAEGAIAGVYDAGFSALSERFSKN